MKEYYVYAKCSGRPEPFLQVEFMGTRSQCKTFINNKARNGRMTHYNFVSCLGITKASRRYL